MAVIGVHARMYALQASDRLHSGLITSYNLRWPCPLKTLSTTEQVTSAGLRFGSDSALVVLSGVLLPRAVSY